MNNHVTDMRFEYVCENQYDGGQGENVGYSDDPTSLKRRMYQLISTHQYGKPDGDRPHALYNDLDCGSGANYAYSGPVYWQGDLANTAFTGSRYVMRPYGLVYFEEKSTKKRDDSGEPITDVRVITLTQQLFTILGTGVDRKTGEPALVLAFVSDGRNAFVTIPRKLMASGETYLAAHLEQHGFRLAGNPSAPKLLRQILMELRGPDVDILDRPGWQRVSETELAFAHPLGMLDNSAARAKEIETEQRKLAKKAGYRYEPTNKKNPMETKRTYFDPRRFSGLKVAKKGSHTKWTEEVAAAARGNSLLTFEICRALASSLLFFTDRVDSRIFNYYGPSSKGKSTIQFVGGSVHGGSDATLGFASSWNSTPNALPNWAATHSHINGALDEMSTDLDNMSSVIQFGYNFSSGVDKMRLDKEADAKRSLEWRLLASSSSEKPLSDMIAAEFKRTKHFAEGVQARIIDVPAMVTEKYGAFENIGRHKRPEHSANALKAAARAHYGHAGFHFIKQLTEYVNEIGEAEFRKEIEAEIDAIVAGWKDGQTASIVTRVAHAFALVEFAGRLAVDFGVFGDELEDDDISWACKKTFEAWVNARGGAGHSQAQAHAIAQLRDFLQSNTARFVTFDPTAKLGLHDTLEAERKTQRFAGYETEHFYYVLPSVFEAEIAGGKTASSHLAKRLEALGLLEVTESERERGSLKKKLKFPKPTRCYAIRKGIRLVRDDGTLDADEFDAESSPEVPRTKVQRVGDKVRSKLSTRVH